MMNVALRDQEGPAARDNANPVSPPGEISLAHKLNALRELAASLLKHVEELEESLAARGGRRTAPLYDEVQRFETELIRDALKKTGGHQRRAARLLGVKVSTLNAKIKRYGIKPEEALGAASLHLVDR